METIDTDRIVKLTGDDHVHSNADVRLFEKEFINEGKEAIDVVFNPEEEKGGGHPVTLICHINLDPETGDPNSYDFLLIKNSETNEWEKVPDNIFPNGILGEFIDYVYEKTGKWITVHTDQ